MWKPLLILPLLVVVAGCATMTEGARQDIVVATPGVEGAQCQITDEQGGLVARVDSAGRAKAPRGRRTLIVRCEKAGFRTNSVELKASMSSRSRIQAPVGYVVDGMSGALWSYPSEVSVVLTPDTMRVGLDVGPRP